MFRKKNKLKLKEYKDIIVCSICEALCIDDEPTYCMLNRNFIDVCFFNAKLHPWAVPVSLYFTYFPKSSSAIYRLVFEVKLPERADLDMEIAEFNRKFPNFPLTPFSVTNMDDTQSIVFSKDFLRFDEKNLHDIVYENIKGIVTEEFDLAADSLIKAIMKNKINIIDA